MIQTNSKDLERRLKRSIPQPIKALFIRLVVNRYVGWLIQKTCWYSLPGGRFDFSSFSPLVAVRIFFGMWEPAEIHFSKKYVKDGDSVIELGSSIGVTLATLCTTKSLKSFIAIEANPNTSKILTTTINNFSEANIVQIEAAVSYCGNDSVEFLDVSLTGSRIAQQSDLSEKKDKVYSVRVLQFGEIVDRYLPAGESYVLISDIEGAEADIFDRDKNALLKCKLMICELENTKNHSIEEQISHLNLAGFVVAEFYGNVFVLERSSL